jgi:ribonuclease T2
MKMSDRAGKVLLLMVMCASLLSPASPKRRRQQKQQTTQQGNFDYYLLSLSWAPNYCAEHPGDNSNECRTGNHKGFVLHGLWPQSNEGEPPMSCQTASPVAGDLVRHMLEYFPSRGMIQHEWQKHGTCSGLSSQEYFAKVEQAFKSVQPPDEFKNLAGDKSVPPQDLDQSFAAANHAPADAFRISCHAQQLVAVEVCMSKDLRIQSCARSLRECPASSVLMHPPK